MRIWILFFLAAIFTPLTAQAHFGMLIPSQAEVVNQKDAAIRLDIAFSHPASGSGMDMALPEAVNVNVDGESASLLNKLSETSFMGGKAWRMEFQITHPGLYQFAVTPAPYFEPAEDCFIIHYAKVAVPAFGSEDGWDQPLGLPMEILPLTRPFGNYAPSVFQGQALKNGKPLPGAIVEIENLNRDPRHVPPNEYFETQVVRADAQGIFTVGIPWSGWWGFAALSEADDAIEFNGQKKKAEIGGIMWVNFAEPRLAK